VESDRECLDALARGEREALVPLMERHYQRLFRVALAYVRTEEEALEVVQDAFVKAWRGAARWDPAGEPAHWLTRIAVNCAIDRYRRQRRRRAREEPLPEHADHDARWVSAGGGADLPLREREVRERLDRALLDLPARQRAVFVLRHYDERSLDEIARVLGLRLGTVKSTLHRAVTRLRETLA
jgi:RNA polymerase sigma-70 factor (ECF subfamily)